MLTERDYVQLSAETGGSGLGNFNNALLNYVDGSPFQFSQRSVDWSNLPRLLLNHTDTVRQIETLNRCLPKFGLPNMMLRTSQLLHFENVSVGPQGSALRSLLSILASLTDTEIRVVLIDEPELSLEPRIQRILRDSLIEASQSKQILVATHSHLFLNRGDPSANLLAQRSGEIVSLSPIASVEQLYDVTFELLGNSIEDLFFPGNFLVVEGSSDQVIVEKTRGLLHIAVPRIKILAASGLENAPGTVEAVAKVLIPVVTRDSPYASKIVALIDRPPDPPPDAVTQLQRVLGNRLFVLSEPSIEEYIPEAIYTRVGRNKPDDVQQIAALRGNHIELGRFKRELSEQIAASLTEADLANLPVIVAAVRKTNE